MTRIKTLPLLAGAATLALGGTLLTGCGAIDGLVHGYSTSTYDTADAMAEAMDDRVAWLPGDATDVVVVKSASADEPHVVISVASEEELDEEHCVEVERRSAPVWEVDGAPDVYAMDRVFACGDWSVVPSDTGWLGWTPNSPGERDAAVAAGATP